MKRHTPMTPFHALMALAVLLTLALALPAIAASGPAALAIPQQMPVPATSGSHQAAMGGMHATMSSAQSSRMHRGQIMMMGSRGMQPESQADQARIDQLLSRVESTSGREQTKAMVDLLESLVAERSQMMSMYGTNGMHGMRGVHTLRGMGGMHGSGPMGQSMQGSTAPTAWPCPMAPAEEQLPSSSPENPIH